MYIGKARDLSKRVHQYFSRDDAVGEKTKTLVAQIDRIETISTPTEFDALLLEAELIRKHLPKYNVISRDDKSPLYIVIHFDEQIPKILQVRKAQMKEEDRQNKSVSVFGPFQSARVARNLLRTVRHIIPYCIQKKRSGRPCFYTHIGLCRPCPSYFEKISDEPKKRLFVKQYRKQLYAIRDILSGKSNRVIRDMQKDMEQHAQKEQFEEASIIKQQVHSLISLQSHKLDPMMYTQTTSQAGNVYEEELLALKRTLDTYIPNVPPLSRIECIDISNISGRQATGSVVVLTGGLSDTGQYRRFKIRLHAETGRPDDPGMIAEVVRRRLAHTEWKYPDLLVVDGGKSSVSAALAVLEECNVSIPLIGLAKRMEDIVIKHKDGVFSTIHISLHDPAIHVLQRVRDEAHRFAKSYHIHLRTLLRNKIPV